MGYDFEDEMSTARFEREWNKTPCDDCTRVDCSNRI